MTAEPLVLGEHVFVQDVKKRIRGMAEVHSLPEMGRPVWLRAHTDILSWWGAGEFSNTNVLHKAGELFPESVYNVVRPGELESTLDLEFD